MGEVGDVESLHAVALAFHGVAEEGAAVHIDDGDIDEAFSAGDADGGGAVGGVGVDGDVHLTLDAADADVLGGEGYLVGPGADVAGAADGADVGVVGSLAHEVADGSVVGGYLNGGAFALAESAEAVLNLPLAAVVGAGGPGEGCRGAVDGGREAGDGVADRGGEGEGVAPVGVVVAIADGAHGGIVGLAGGEVDYIGGVSGAGIGLAGGGVEDHDFPLGLTFGGSPVDYGGEAVLGYELKAGRSEAGHGVGGEGAGGPFGSADGVAELAYAELVGRFGGEFGEGVGGALNGYGLRPGVGSGGLEGYLEVVAVGGPGYGGSVVGVAYAGDDGHGAYGGSEVDNDVVDGAVVVAGSAVPTEGQETSRVGHGVEGEGVGVAVAELLAYAGVYGGVVGVDGEEGDEVVVEGVVGVGGEVAHFEVAALADVVLGAEPEGELDVVEGFGQFGQTGDFGVAVGGGARGHHESVRAAVAEPDGAGTDDVGTVGLGGGVGERIPASGQYAGSGVGGTAIGVEVLGVGQFDETAEGAEGLGNGPEAGVGGGDGADVDVVVGGVGQAGEGDGVRGSDDGGAGAGGVAGGTVLDLPLGGVAVVVPVDRSRVGGDGIDSDVDHAGNVAYGDVVEVGVADGYEGRGAGCAEDEVAAVAGVVVKRHCELSPDGGRGAGDGVDAHDGGIVVGVGHGSHDDFAVASGGAGAVEVEGYLEVVESYAHGRQSGDGVGGVARVVEVHGGVARVAVGGADVGVAGGVVGVLGPAGGDGAGGAGDAVVEIDHVGERGDGAALGGEGEGSPQRRVGCRAEGADIDVVGAA